MNTISYLLICFAFVFLAIEAAEEDPAGKRILVLLENHHVKSTHSTYFKFLEDSKYNVTFFSVDDRSIQLRKYGEWNYDHLIVFATSAGDMPGLSSDLILDFIDAGHNVILAADSDIGDLVREVGSECNVEFDEAETNVIDHLNFDASDYSADHTLIVADRFADAPIIFKGIEAPVLFRGVGQDIEEDSSLLFSLLSGSTSAYSHSPSEPVKDLHVAGKKTSLVSALQARNNARVIFSGSLEMFSDKLFNSPVQRYSADGKSQRYEKSGNENFCKQITQWALQEKGVLRVKNANTHKVGETVAPFSYTIKQDIDYSIEIEEWNGRRWAPFAADDVQLEYRMLDPYVRTSLKHNGKGIFHTTFKLPDVYGVFTFKVEYSRKGFSYFNSIIRIPVRPFRHNEYERFIDSAYPYYASAFSMMAGLFVFSWVFLYHSDK